MDDVADKPLLVSVPSAMQVTSLGRTKIYELISSGDLASIKVGSRRLIPMSAIRDLIQSLLTPQT